jgi:thioredoxin
VKVTEKIFVLSVAAAALIWCLDTGCSSANLNSSSANVKQISQNDFATQVSGSNSSVVVDFYAPWCGPCRELSPMLDRLAGPYTNNIKFVKVNLDEASDLGQKYSVEAIPTLLFMRNGLVVDRTVGLLPEPELKAKLDSLSTAN